MNTKICDILSENINEINIVKMIITDSMNIDLNYDIIKDFESDFFEIKNNQNNITNFKVKELLDMCKKYKLKSYSELNKKDLIKKLNLFFENKKKQIIKQNKIKYEFFNKVNINLTNLVNKIQSSVDKKEKVINIIEIYKYLIENMFFLIVYKNFYNVIMNKIKEFKKDIILYYPEKLDEFLKYNSLLLVLK